MKTALNHVTAPRLPYPAFLDLAARLGCAGVEIRNDLGRPLFDGMPARAAGAMARDRGLRLLGMGQVQPFDLWDRAREGALRALLDAAGEAGAEGVALVPANDGTAPDPARLAEALAAIGPMLDAAGMTGLVEPLGFAGASLRDKGAALEAIDAGGRGGRFALVHDTFHHALAGGGPLFAARTGIVHVSAVADPAPAPAAMRDGHRVLPGPADRLDTVAQVAALAAAGYDGAISWECFASETQALENPFDHLKASFDYVAARVQSAPDWT